MSVQFHTYREDGTPVDGVMTDRGLQLRGGRGNRFLYYVSHFKIGAIEFESLTRASKADASTHPLVYREAMDIETMAVHGFYHFDSP